VKSTNPFAIPIDGPNGSGKTTLITMLSDYFTERDKAALAMSTGDYYRIVVLAALGSVKGNMDCLKNLCGDECVEAATANQFNVIGGKGYLNGQLVEQCHYRTQDVAMAASHVAKLPDVRNYVNGHIIAQVNSFDGVVLVDGRDIGTVVLPDAEVKLFLTVDAEESARRQNQAVQLIRERDLADSTRKIAPLMAANDARVLDTTKLAPDQVLEWAISHIQESFPHLVR
jgi:cytidylate kinase